MHERCYQLEPTEPIRKPSVPNNLEKELIAEISRHPDRFWANMESGEVFWKNWYLGIDETLGVIRKRFIPFRRIWKRREIDACRYVRPEDLDETEKRPKYIVNFGALAQNRSKYGIL